LNFIPDPRYAEFRRPVKFELLELKSFFVTPKSKFPQQEVIFILSDGSTMNPFIFQHGSPSNLIGALERWISISKLVAN